MTVWFTSDTHYGHHNVIGYSKRPFASVEEMEDGLISRFNARVQPRDTVYHLGDFAWREDIATRVLSRMHGRIHLIAGNHDHTRVRRLPGWASVQHYLEVKLDGHHLILCHYAMRVWNRAHHGAMMLYGHSHGNLQGNSQSHDVGVDVWGYEPVALVEIMARMSDLEPWQPVDHHRPPEAACRPTPG